MNADCFENGLSNAPTSAPLQQRNDAALILKPLQLCETLAGNLAYVVGRIAFHPGRPLLVEHVGGVYLMHDVFGRVLTPLMGSEYDIVHVFQD